VRSFEERLRLLPDIAAIHDEWRKLLVTHNVSGVRVHDARLVAAMRIYGVKRILTFNNMDFANYADVDIAGVRLWSARILAVQASSRVSRTERVQRGVANYLRIAQAIPSG